MYDKKRKKKIKFKRLPDNQEWAKVTIQKDWFVYWWYKGNSEHPYIKYRIHYDQCEVYEHTTQDAEIIMKRKLINEIEAGFYNEYI